jgi:polynucleotide 5'-hydroxyl-kinase GRC3/NOL9
MQCVRQCFQDYLVLKSKDENIPLIVNTMGWNQGLGLCLLKESVLVFQPTHLIQINHPIEANKNMPVLDKNWLQTSDGWPSSINKINTNVNKSANAPNSSSKLMDIDYSHINYKHLVLKSHVPFKIAKFQSPKPPQKRFSPKDHRNFAIIAYFSSLQDLNMCFKPIHHLRPYKILWSKLGLHISHSQVDYDQLFRVFNASLVGLCQVDSKYVSFF